jgi:hypothetical protein
MDYTYELQRLKSATQHLTPAIYKKLKIESLENLINCLENIELQDTEGNRLILEIVSLTNNISENDKKTWKVFKNSLKNLKNHFRKTHGVVEKNYYQNQYMSLGIAIGVAIGSAFITTYPAFLAIYMSIGLSTGIAIGAGKDKKAAEQKKVY